MNNELDIPVSTALVPNTLGGKVHIEVKADWGGFHAGVDANVTYSVERHGDMLRIVGHKHGHFNAHYGFTIDLPVEMVRGVIEGERGG